MTNSLGLANGEFFQAFLVLVSQEIAGIEIERTASGQRQCQQNDDFFHSILV